MVDKADDLDPQWFVGKHRVGLTAGASAPEILVQQVVERLRKHGAVSVRNVPGVEEKIHFPLPKGLREPNEVRPLSTSTLSSTPSEPSGNAR